MGLFSRGSKAEPQINFDLIPSASDITASEMLGLPLAENVRVTDGPHQPYAAYSLSLQGKVAEAEQALLDIITNADEANQWLARMELGTLLFDMPNRINEGLYLLVQCLTAPFIDVARNAAWNLQEVLRLNGLADRAKEYEDLAVGLHSPLGMVLVAERLAEAGSEAESKKAFEFAAENLSRLGDFRARVERGLAEYRLSGVDPHAAEVFRDGLGLLTENEFSSSYFYMNALARFNSEAGSAGIANQYFADCEAQCYFENTQVTCSVCGRNPSNYISVPSGDGDGVYPVFTFFDKSSEPEGAITIFRDLIQDLIDAGEQAPSGSFSPAAGGLSAAWASYLGSGSPIYLGEIDIVDKLIFSDGSKSAGDADLSIVVDTKPGKYAVICWLSLPNEGDDTIRPLALAAVGGHLRDSLLSEVDELSLEEVNQLRKELWGGDFTVFAHAQDIRSDLAINNFEMHPEPDETFEGLSWLLQQAEFKDGGLYELIRSQNLPDEPTLRALLARRGILDAKLPWFDRSSPSPSLGQTTAAPSGLTKSNGGGLSLAKFCVSCGSAYQSESQKFCDQCGQAR